MDNEKIPPGPACPGKVKTRPTTTRLTLSSASNVLDAFLREDLSGSGDEVSEEAFLELLARYDIHVSELSSFVSSEYSLLSRPAGYAIAKGLNWLKIAVEQLDSLFTAVTYNQAARCFWLDPSRGGEDMRFLEIYRSRIPSHIFKGIVDSWDMAITQYGPLQGHGEVARPRVITTVIYFLQRKTWGQLGANNSQLFEKMGAVFKSAVISKPGGLLNRSSIRPRFRKQYEILQELSNVVFLQVSRELASGSSALDVKAWLLAECSGMLLASWWNVCLLTTCQSLITSTIRMAIGRLYLPFSATATTSNFSLSTQPHKSFIPPDGFEVYQWRMMTGNGHCSRSNEVSSFLYPAARLSLTLT